MAMELYSSVPSAVKPAVVASVAQLTGLKHLKLLGLSPSQLKRHTRPWRRALLELTALTGLEHLTLYARGGRQQKDTTVSFRNTVSSWSPHDGNLGSCLSRLPSVGP
jgi:hypothetical protein